MHLDYDQMAIAIVTATKKLDPRDNTTVAEVIEKHLRLCEAEVCPEKQAIRAKRLHDFAKIHGHKRIEECTPIDLQEFLENPAWRSGRTRNSARSEVLRAFNWALKMRLIRENPFTGCPKAPEGPGGRPIADPVFRAVMQNVKPHVRRLLTFIRFTWCRPCEAMRLRWGQIDWQRRVAVLREHKTAKKTGKPRILYLRPPVIKLLRWIERRRASASGDPAAVWIGNVLAKGPVKIRDLAQQARQRGLTARQVYRGVRAVGGRLEWIRLPGNDKDRACRHKTRLKKCYVLDGPPIMPRVDNPSDLVFLTLKRTKWTRTALSTILYRIAAIGIIPRGTRSYGLRHRGATEAVRAGVNLLVVAKAMGHESVITTQKYADTIADDVDLIIREMDKSDGG
jgi:integrase